MLKDSLHNSPCPSYLKRGTLGKPSCCPSYFKRGILGTLSCYPLKNKHPLLNIPLKIRGIKGVMNVSQLPL
jgi:hypothetical protein